MHLRRVKVRCRFAEVLRDLLLSLKLCYGTVSYVAVPLPGVEIVPPILHLISPVRDDPGKDLLDHLRLRHDLFFGQYMSAIPTRLPDVLRTRDELLELLNRPLVV